MKKSILLLTVLFLSFNLFAQKGISFQGIARDAAGNAITGASVPVTFTIGSFIENQDLTTDDFGIFSATIGSVNTTDFESLIFANINENLKVEVNNVTIYNDKFNTVPYAKAAENGVPVGSIMPWAGSVTSGNSLQEPITGWVVCNGATLGTDTKYDELKTVLGTAWGSGLVPDLRGTFLRGVNNGRTDGYKDPDAASRLAVNAGNSGDKVGSFQGEAVKSHKHNVSATIASSGTMTINMKWQINMEILTMILHRAQVKMQIEQALIQLEQENIHTLL
jgi:microcystin-dependent protein